jgi:type I restriction enzyme R subunit
MEDNQDIFNKILDDDSFGDVVKKWMMKKVYKNVNEVK